MAQLFESLDQRVIARDRFHPSIWIDKVGAAIPDMGNRDLLTEHESGGECRSTARRLALNGALRFAHCGLHDLLERFIHRICFDMEEIGMELAQNVSRNGADGR